jgi:hypothetical protein
MSSCPAWSPVSNELCGGPRNPMHPGHEQMVPDKVQSQTKQFLETMNCQPTTIICCSENHASSLGLSSIKLARGHTFNKLSSAGKNSYFGCYFGTNDSACAQDFANEHFPILGYLYQRTNHRTATSLRIVVARDSAYLYSICPIAKFAGLVNYFACFDIPARSVTDN